MWLSNNPVNMLVFTNWLPIIGIMLIGATAIFIIFSFFYWYLWSKEKKRTTAVKPIPPTDKSVGILGVIL